ncbi:MAG: hypothetical protein EBU82_06820 [Flavobacteriia bacterium]|jgi:hypothetical protein|nr:hypothetical protein [Flavobacteriia bacterium]
MVLELIFIVAVLFAVFILFYRQAIEQYNILQIESNQVEELPKLLSERTPLVLHDIGQPKLFTPETLKANARLQQFPIGAKQTLGQYLQHPTPQVSLTKKASLLLAKESGLATWGEHTWFPKLFQYPFLQHIHTFTTEAILGEQGLRKTTGIVTILYPTSGALEVTLMTEHQEKCLPPQWRGRFPEVFTIQDTPLAGELKYITIKLRPGNMLCVPTHWYTSVRVVEKDKPACWTKYTLDNPISWVASTMEGSLDA